MKISIITPSYNQAEYIDETIQSVLNQDYENIEHIVVDGGSSDNTVEVLNKYNHLNWVSEKDKGQTDALNKGIRIATGEIIGWINSDDFYEENVFQKISEAFQDPNCMWLIGNLTKLFEPSKELIRETSKKITFNNLTKNPDIVRQQCTFFRASFLRSIGEFDESLHLVMDFDMWLRLSKNAEPIMVNENLAYFRIHSAQKTSGKHAILQLSEMKKVLNQHPNGMKYFHRIWAKKYLNYAVVMIKSIFGIKGRHY